MNREDAVHLVCGCQGWTVDDVFMFEPCSDVCPAYVIFLETAEEEGKPVTTLDLR